MSRVIQENLRVAPMAATMSLYWGVDFAGLSGVTDSVGKSMVQRNLKQISNMLAYIHVQQGLSVIQYVDDVF